MKFRLNYAAILDDTRKVGVGLILAGLVGTIFKYDVSYLVGIIGVTLGVLFIIIGAISVKEKS